MGEQAEVGYRTGRNHSRERAELTRAGDMGETKGVEYVLRASYCVSYCIYCVSYSEQQIAGVTDSGRFKGGGESFFYKTIMSGGIGRAKASGERLATG